MSDGMSDFDDATRRWVEEKHPTPRRLRAAEEMEAGNRIIREASEKGKDAVLSDALEPQLALATGDVVEKRQPKTLADKLLVPSFSTLDTRAGYWQARRRAWLSLGLRGETLTEHAYRPSSGGDSQRQASGAYMGHGNSGGRKGKDGEFGGRSQGLVYQHDAPGSDPSFYSRKRVVENELGRELTTEEFKRDYYDREQALDGQSDSVQTGTSVFDPVLCEVAYRWFSAEGHAALDPFAGGAVRGIVAGVLGRRYLGVELRPEQIDDNRRQAGALLSAEAPYDFGREPTMPKWVEGDAVQLRALDLEPCDLVFTCPPYADLEVYSDNPRDLSTASYAEFRAMLSTAMAQSAALLKPDRFSVWVVGEAREGTSGCSYGIVSDTIRAARDANLGLYNEAILLNSVGSAALRSQRILRTRKLTRVHQHVLVFVKGDWRRAAEACGDVELEL